MGAAALKSGQYARAAKLFGKSLQLYPLPGVEAMLSQARSRANEGSQSSTANNHQERSFSTNREAPQRSTSTASSTNGSTNGSQSGRSYTPEHVRIVKHILESKKGGRGAHYRVLGVAENATESDLKKAYRYECLPLLLLLRKAMRPLEVMVKGSNFLA
jgi:hypothetical protein